MVQSAMPSPPAPPSKRPPVLLVWTLMTAMGAAIFGVLMATIGAHTDVNSFAQIFVAVLMGGLIVAWLEWQTLRFYRIPMGIIWCGVKPGMMLLLLGIMAALNRHMPGESFFLLPLGGILMDASRWWLLRSHFSRASWWLVFCFLGWLADTVLFTFAGMMTLSLVSPVIAFVALNGAINGTWMGLCRGFSLMLMLRDRQAKTRIVTSPQPVK